MPSNTGGAGGFAAGLAEIARRFDPDWTLLMDDDARPLPGACAAFLARTDLGAFDAVAAGVFYPDGRICDMNRPSRNPFWHLGDFLRTLTGGREGFHVTDEAYDPAQAHLPQPIDATSFVGFFPPLHLCRRRHLHAEPRQARRQDRLPACHRVRA